LEAQKYKSVEAYSRVKIFFTDQQVVVQEKMDGSNVAIGKDAEGNVWYQSRTQIINVESPGLFSRFVAWAQQESVQKAIQTFEGPVIFYGETLNTNKLKYERVEPFVLFDIQTPDSWVEDWLWLEEWASQLGCPSAPLLWRGNHNDLPPLTELITKSCFDSRPDFLAEGVVIKAYDCDRWYYVDGVKNIVREPLLSGKLVRDDFKETKAPRKEIVDPLDKIADAFFTSARFDKGLQKLRESNTSLASPNLLMREVVTDIHREEEDAIKDMLFASYWKPISSKLQKLTLNEYNTRQLG